MGRLPILRASAAPAEIDVALSAPMNALIAARREVEEAKARVTASNRPPSIHSLRPVLQLAADVTFLVVYEALAPSYRIDDRNCGAITEICARQRVAALGHGACTGNGRRLVRWA
ncbi:MAG: hypothetical protein AB7G88_08925 [Thermomicrobiales bacterium]